MKVVMNSLFILCFSMLLGLAPEQTEVPAEIEKVNLKLSEDELAMTFFSLSNGEATLLQHANGENVLVNTGGPSSLKEFKKYLEMYDVDKLKSVIITSESPLYKTNLNWVLDHYEVNQVIVAKKATKILEELLLKGENVVKWSKGETHMVLPDLITTVLHDEHDVKAKKGMDLSFKYGTHSTLFMTSANYEVEDFLSQNELKDINILKVPEFAHKDGTSQRFLENVDPQVAIIFTKKGQLPSQEVVERLHGTWIDIYQTKLFGTISIKFNPNHYDVITISQEGMD